MKEQRTEQPRDPRERRPYQKPELVVHGRLEELTRSGGGGGTDAFGGGNSPGGG